MKLYGNVTSERASKGQGGQKYIRFTVTHDRLELFDVVIFPDKRMYYSKSALVEKFQHVMSDDIDELLKGKKEKDEVCANGYKMPCNICPKDGIGNCTT